MIPFPLLLVLSLSMAAPASLDPGADPAAEADARAYQIWLQAFREEEAKIVLPIDPRHRRLELTPFWLEGYWVSGKAACYGSDSGIHLRADQSWSDGEGEGRYEVMEGQIRFAAAPPASPEAEAVAEAPSAFKAQPIGPNEMEADWGNDTKGPLYRCPASGMPPETAGK